MHASAASNAHLLGSVSVSWILPGCSARAVGVVDKGPVHAGSAQDIAHRYVYNDDCVDQTNAAAGIGRSFDEDAADNDDLADADHADLAVLLFGAQRAGTLLDGQQHSWSFDSALDKSNDG